MLSLLWNIFVCVAVLCILFVTVAVGLYYLKPSLLLEIYLRMMLRSTGMVTKYLKDGDFTYCYAERGKKSADRSSLLLLHGYTGGKFDWIGPVQRLPTDLHIIILETPGHGGTSPVPVDEEITFDSFIKRIDRFVSLIGLDDKPFHMVGQSLGGCFAGLYASEYSHKLDRVTLVCPAMKGNEETDFSRECLESFERGVENIQPEHVCLLPQSIEELEKMMELVVKNPKKLPKQVLQGAIDLRKPRIDTFLRIFKGLIHPKNATFLEDRAHKIKVPVSVVFGKEDQIVHPSVVDVLQKHIPDLDIHLVDDCGHSINVERPWSLVKAILKFRGEYTPKEKED